MRHSLLVALLALSPAVAQDMIGVTWSGSIIAFDSFTGVGSTISGGHGNMNSLARDQNGTLWTAVRPAGTWELAVVDPDLGTVTSLSPCSDFRGLAWHDGQLYGVKDSPDSLVTIDTGTGTETTIGPCGFSAVQSLCSLDGQLYAWDVNAGLLRIDDATGAATAVDPVLGSNGASVQWLGRRADGQLVGGNTTLYTINPVTGAASAIGGLGLSDMRGAEPLQDYVRNFGSGCAGGGGQVTSTATIGGGVGSQLTLQSNHHDANAIGLVVLGLSNTQSNGLPLPVSVDPVFGTSGCTLYVSLDVSLLALTDATFPATLTVQVPILATWPGASLFVQHAVLENVPGGLSLSDAAVVQFGY